MFVSVLYHTPEINGYAGKRYTFYTKLPLVEGQKVLVPPDGQKALVREINLDESEIVGQPWAKDIKEITQFDIE